MNFHIITLFPHLIQSHLSENPFKKAQHIDAVKYTTWNLRDYAIDKRGTVDDRPYSGGVGMILRIEPIYNALQDIKAHCGLTKPKIILLSPRGETFDQKKAMQLSKEENIVLICGRYEGVDARVEQYLVDETISIGNYVLTGGEVPALVIMEAITRLLPNVLEKETASTNESFSIDQDKKEYPQYTRPDDFENMKVPEILLSGNHKEIENWKKDNTK